MNDSLPKLSVSELTALVKTTLEGSFYNLTVEGEISGFRPASTGHWYFSLKDNGAVISAAMWRSNIRKVGFIPKDGQRVIVKGNLSVYEQRGTYQIICSSIEPFGEGDILAMLEERKRHYAQLGYFDESQKKPIPRRPNRVAVITSPTGAALQDILQITGRRSPSMDIIILPAVVQGSEAAQSVATRIKEVNDFLLADVMIVGRGGGSIEDLLPFSEDCVIEAIHQSDIPVISAVGHEIDWALSDFVADLRAPTPSAAAELVCESALDQMAKVEGFKASMKESMASRISAIRLRVAAFSKENAKAQLENRLSHNRMRLDYATSSLRREVCNLVAVKKSKLEMLSHKIEVLSPLSILDRGYGILTTKGGKTLRSVSQVKVGDCMEIMLADGQISACVKEVHNGK
jgi:exodeoxyribonuclease VII large subunit